MKMNAEPNPNSNSKALYRICLCCHVELGTLIYGFLNAIIQFLLLFLLVVAAIRPDVLLPENRMQLSDGIYVEVAKGQMIELRDKVDARTKWQLESNSDHLSQIFGITCILFVSSVALIYGIVRKRPGYILPFFCICVFDLSVTVLTTICGFTYASSMKQWVYQQRIENFPGVSHLMCMDSSNLALVVVLALILIISFKAYMVHMVWLCYKYVQMKVASRGVTREYTSYPDAEMLLPPAYADAIKMSPSPTSPPPPAYSAQ